MKLRTPDKTNKDNNLKSNPYANMQQIGVGRNDLSVPKFESAMAQEFPNVPSSRQASNQSLGEISQKSPNAQFDAFDSKGKKSIGLNNMRIKKMDGTVESEESKNPMVPSKRTIGDING